MLDFLNQPLERHTLPKVSLWYRSTRLVLYHIFLSHILIWHSIFALAPQSIWKFTWTSLTHILANTTFSFIVRILTTLISSSSLSMQYMEDSSNLLAKWFFLLHLLQVFSQAGRFCLSGKCSKPQNLHDIFIPTDLVFLSSSSEPSYSDSSYCGLFCVLILLA